MQWAEDKVILCWYYVTDIYQPAWIYLILNIIIKGVMMVSNFPYYYHMVVMHVREFWKVLVITSHHRASDIFASINAV